jgi:hypothetical protein
VTAEEMALVKPGTVLRWAPGHYAPDPIVDVEVVALVPGEPRKAIMRPVNPDDWQDSDKWPWYQWGPQTDLLLRTFEHLPI